MRPGNSNVSSFHILGLLGGGVKKKNFLPPLRTPMVMMTNFGSHKMFKLLGIVWVPYLSLLADLKSLCWANVICQDESPKNVRFPSQIRIRGLKKAKLQQNDTVACSDPWGLVQPQGQDQPWTTTFLDIELQVCQK